MSVLKKHRQQSKCEYVYTAYQIYIKTINFLSRVSARYSRLIASDTARLASEAIDYAEMAENVYNSDEIRVALREEYLLKARASISALDVRLAVVYDILSDNPQGAFTTAHGKETLKASEAVEKLDKMSMTLGELIDSELSLLTGALTSLKVKVPKSKSNEP